MAVLGNYLFLENHLLCTRVSNRYAKPLVLLQRKMGPCFQNKYYSFHSSFCKLKNTFSTENLAVIGCFRNANNRSLILFKITACGFREIVSMLNPKQHKSVLVVKCWDLYNFPLQLFWGCLGSFHIPRHCVRDWMHGL